MTEPWHCNDGMAFPIRRHRSLESKGFSTATQRRGFSLRSIVDAGSGIVDARPPGAYRLTIALQKQRSRCWALRRIAILTISLHCFAQWPLRRRAHHQENGIHPNKPQDTLASSSAKAASSGRLNNISLRTLRYSPPQLPEIQGGKQLLQGDSTRAATGSAGSFPSSRSANPGSTASCRSITNSTFVGRMPQASLPNRTLSPS
ncbi:hypothetical protein CLAIMM_09645 isoform 2 [Cladophialophora immunda]|nr:hypothetical protein CLAIMM_09645 isoform 2 [Cladophialophora immunda]